MGTINTRGMRYPNTKTSLNHHQDWDASTPIQMGEEKRVICCSYFEKNYKDGQL